MELIYLGKKYTGEKNCFYPENEFGFKVTVTYKKDWPPCIHEGKQIIEAHNNCTEVDYLYESLIPKNERRIAFESDIHNTGCHRCVDDIESVVIELADEIESEF